MKHNAIQRSGQRGLTLIESMLVIAAIGIIVTLAIPRYQDSVAETTWAAGMAEISSAKTGLDAQISAGRVPTLSTIGLAASSEHCDNTVSGSLTAASTLACRLKGGPSGVNGKTITLTRAAGAAAGWTCKTEAPQKYVGPGTVCAGT